MKNPYEQIAALAQKSPRKAAILSCDEEGNVREEITYAQLLRKIEAAAAGMAASGLKDGDRIALKFENCPELLIVSWAAWSMGIVTVPLDIKRDTEELYQYKVKASKAKVVITKETMREWNIAEKVEWKKGVSHEALILFTSGTTAKPKGAKLSLKNLIVNAGSIAEWLSIVPSDRFLVQLPLHHINSTTFCISIVLAGGSIAIPPRYSNSRFWKQAALTGATCTSIVQSIVFDQLQRKAEYHSVQGVLKLTRIQIGSAPVVATSAEEFMREFHIPLYQGYGQTETALRVTGMPTNLPAALFERLVKENSIGIPMNWAEVEVADENGHLLGENDEGELIVKGPAVMEGYVGGEPAFRNGYFLTGDIGCYRTIEGRRFFFLRGRKSEMIIKGGINISPIAVENSLKKISDDIDQVYVVGVEDERYGQEVGAVMCFKPGTEEERAKCLIKLDLLSGTPHVSQYEMPKFLRVVSHSELPMTSTGKVQRTVLAKSPRGAYESVYELITTPHYRFVVIDLQSPYREASRALYNHCWQPLTAGAPEYKQKLAKGITLAAIDQQGTLAGQISFVMEGKKLTCISICSASYVSKPIPQVKTTPPPAEVEAYLLAGHDPVMNFHTKMGATLVKVIPHSRPDDASALGYTMLLKYPTVSNIKIVDDSPVSVQLIAAARLLSKYKEATTYALSRPGGLAAYLSRK
jgi:acyl-CoA synthetase (AMP-forming)/AMP-acid ligase II